MSKGFSLLEMAVVMVILTLLLSGALIPLATIKESEQIRATKATILEAFDSLQGFAVLHGRLPCPDQDGDGDGEPTGICEGDGDTVEGFLPWKQLGLQKRFDAWGQVFHYRILANGAKKLRPGMKSELWLVNWQGIPLTEQEPKDSNVAILIYSIGKDKTANVVSNGTTYSEIGAGDDIVNWMSVHQLYFVFRNMQYEPD
jgi:prepilin-type N-terminal cleavage/methylation domain-containing protein